MTDPDREPALQYGAPTDLKRGEVFNLRNHIEIVEDLSFLRSRRQVGGPPNRKCRREFIWAYGVPDEEGERRERIPDRGRNNLYHHRHDDYDDDDDYRRDQRHRGTRRHHSVSSWVRNSRCRGGVEDCHSATWRRYAGSSGHRHRVLPMTTDTHLWRPKKSTSMGGKKKVSFSNPLVTARWPKEDGLALDP